MDLSLEKGSRDNISAIIVRLPGIKIAPSGGGVAARQAVRQANEKAAEEEKRGKRAQTLSCLVEMCSLKQS